VSAQPLAQEPGSLELDLPLKPRLRGRFHQAAFFVAIPAGIVLIALAQGTTARTAAVIYALSLGGLFGVSGMYHALPFSAASRRWMKRLDHAMIFVLIAGTTTPLCLVVLQKPWSVILLLVVWGGAVAGIALKILRVEGFHGVTGTLYITLGWAVVLVSPQLVRALSPAALSLIVAGGLLYTLGAIVLLRNRPNPAPATFGYHEIWHSMVVVASACHYVAVLLIVHPARPPFIG
jgi:hemolysin III